MTSGPDLLPPALLARLGRLRLTQRRRVEGRFTGAHASRRYGSSLEFADHRPYVPGDDPRTVDVHARARLGRLLVKLYEAEDEAALRLVVDTSESMRFGAKAIASRRAAAALASVALAGGDRVRILLAGGLPGPVDAGPWLRGRSGLIAAQQRLRAAPSPAPGRLGDALRRAHGEGPRGPVALFSDLLFPDHDAVLRSLAAAPADALCLHVVGRDDLEPDIDGDLRLVDVETGVEVEVADAAQVLAAHHRARDAWLERIVLRCGRAGIAYARLVDDEPVEDLIAVRLAGLGVVA